MKAIRCRACRLRSLACEIGPPEFLTQDRCIGLCTRDNSSETEAHAPRMHDDPQRRLRSMCQRKAAVRDQIAEHGDQKSDDPRCGTDQYPLDLVHLGAQTEITVARHATRCRVITASVADAISSARVATENGDAAVGESGTLLPSGGAVLLLFPVSQEGH